MRVLHAVKMHEKLVASGIYQHRTNGTATGTSEQWSIHELPDGASLIRVDYDARDERGLTILVEALTLPGQTHQFERFDLHQIATGNQPFRKARTTVTCSENSALIGTAIDGGAMEYSEMAFAPETLVYPPGQVFAGALVKHLNSIEMPAQVFSLLDASLEQAAAVHSLHTVRPQGMTNVTLGGREIALQCFRLHGSNPSLSGVFCLNEHDILTRRVQPDEDGQERVIVLTQYAHR
ncbi:MAG: hypothetical protein H6672_11580 [Anaerolineaceae bacterium]|nr:hypothetical protein [Anaerolineaceae bacterium]